MTFAQILRVIRSFSSCLKVTPLLPVIRRTSAGDDGTTLSYVSLSLSVVLIKFAAITRERKRANEICSREDTGVRHRQIDRVGIVEIIVDRDKNRQADKAAKERRRGRARKKMLDDDDDVSEDGKIISRAKESTMPARYCIRPILIHARGVKSRWTKITRDRERETKRDRRQSCITRLPVRSSRLCSNLLKQIGLFMRA